MSFVPRLWSLAVCAIAAGLPALAEGSELLDALEQAPLIVVGQVEQTGRLGPTGRVASLTVERSLRGESRPLRLEVVREELAPSLPDRLQPGRRMLLALEPLPTASIWKRRLPEAERRAAAHHIAGRGSGTLLRPRAYTLDRLEHWLALTPEARSGDAGAIILAQLVPVADPRLALECVASLDTPALESRLSPALQERVLAGLDREEHGIARALALVLERRRPSGLAPVLEARVAERGVDATASLLYAAGALGAAAPSFAADAKLGPEQRRALTRWRSGPGAADALARSLQRSEDPQVRAAAVERYLELRGVEGLEEALRSLEDPEPSVRAAGSRAIATLGPDAVVPLFEYAGRGSGDAARAAVATLSRMGLKAHLALARLADEHADEDVRMLARMAVGRPVGHDHEH